MLCILSEFSHSNQHLYHPQSLQHHPSSLSVFSSSLSLPSSLFPFLYDNESIMCATHSQLSNSQVRGEVDRSCRCLPQIKCCMALLVNCHRFLVLISIVNNLYSYASSTQDVGVFTSVCISISYLQ